MFVEGLPEPQKRPRVHLWRGRVVTQSPKSQWYGAVYWQAKAKRPRPALEGPVGLKIVFMFPLPKSRKPKAGLDDWKDTRPDIDNLAKAVMDALTLAGWWKDDGQVALQEMEKKYAGIGGRAGAFITAYQIRGD